MTSCSHAFPFRHIAGVVLAGGRSLRMGRDKALLPLCRSGKETSLLDHAVAMLTGLCSTVLVSCASDVRYAGHVCIPDMVLTQARPMDGPLPPHLAEQAGASPGPLLGLLSSLRHVRDMGLQGMLTLPCDMPDMQTDLLADLLRASCGHPDAQALFYRTPGGWEEPLVGLYRCTALPGLEEALRCGNRRVRAALPPERRCCLPLPEARHACFAGCNTPEQAVALGVPRSAVGLQVQTA